MGLEDDWQEPVGCYFHLLLLIVVILFAAYVFGNWLIEQMS
jgi:hypothetical protein